MATTLNELLELARTRRRGRLDGQGEQAADELANGLLELLGEDQPCGFDEPRGRHNTHGNHFVICDIELASLTPSDARAYAAMLLRAADEAEVG